MFAFGSILPKPKAWSLYRIAAAKSVMDLPNKGISQQLKIPIWMSIVEFNFQESVWSLF